jgi:hypothetical protein
MKKSGKWHKMGVSYDLMPTEKYRSYICFYYIYFEQEGNLSS